MAALLCGGVILAQDPRGTMIGRVTDSSGAYVAAAKVHATNTATNRSASSVTNTEGNFEIPYLIPGEYRVTAELEGFKTAVRQGIELRVGDRLAVDFELAVGDVTQSVVVSGETPLLETSTASIGMVIDQSRTSELPVVGGSVSISTGWLRES